MHYDIYVKGYHTVFLIPVNKVEMPWMFLYLKYFLKHHRIESILLLTNIIVAAGYYNVLNHTLIDLKETRVLCKPFFPKHRSIHPNRISRRPLDRVIIQVLILFLGLLWPKKISQLNVLYIIAQWTKILSLFWKRWFVNYYL